MASNNQPQTHDGFFNTRRGEYGHTDKYDLGMTNNLTENINKHDEVPRTPQARRREIHPNTSNMQAQPSPKYPAAAALDDGFEEGENCKAGEQQELFTANRTNKSVRASKAKEGARRGLTYVNGNGELEWLATADGEGVLAVRHDDIRPQLIAMQEAERVALGVENEYPDEPGPGKYNVTSFYQKHVHWGPDREDRPEILFDWEEDREENPRPTCPGYMYWKENGESYIVLDPHDNPVKNWDIPLTIASNIPGYKLEAMRRKNMSLGHKDFWARMQSRINVGTEDQPVWEELGNPNSVVNMPMERFRFNAGLCSWTERKKTLIIKAGLKKLYGNKLQKNTVKAFGRDLSKKEINEIKKGNNAIFPIEGDVVPGTQKAHRKPKSKGETGPMQTKGNSKMAKARSLKRKHSVEEEEDMFSDEETLSQVRSHKRARYGRKDNSISAEVDDLLMFEHIPTIIDEDDGTQRYSLRSTRRDAKASQKREPNEELSDNSSTDEDYESISAQRSSRRNICGVQKARGKCDRTERSSCVNSAEEKKDFVATCVQTVDESHSESGKADSAIQGSSTGTDDEGIQADRFPLRQIAGAGDIGGKSIGPSWMSSIKKENQGGEESNHRQAVVPKSIGGSIYYSTYESPISNGGSDTLMQDSDAEWAQVFEQTFIDLGFQTVNYSEVRPWNKKESQSLIDALLPTREVYLAWTGEPGPRTDPHRSYREQFDTIFGAFQNWWRKHRTNEPLPILTGVMHWGGSVDDWEPPSKDSIYYEAFRNGHRAPRTVDGGASDRPGATLEDAFRMRR